MHPVVGFYLLIGAFLGAEALSKWRPRTDRGDMSRLVLVAVLVLVSVAGFIILAIDLVAKL